MGILINKISIENFRSLQQIEVELSPFTLLVGANNAGKTSFLKALHFALSKNAIPNKRTDLFRNIEGKYAQSADEEQYIIIDIHIVSYDYEEKKRLKKFEDEWLIFGEDAYQQDENDYQFIAFRKKFVFENFKDTPTSIDTNVIINWETKETNEGNIRLGEELHYYFIDAQRDVFSDINAKRSYFGLLANQLDIKEEDLEKIQQKIDVLNAEAADASPALTFLKTKLQNLNSTIQSGKGKGVEITAFPKRIDDIHKEMKMYYGENNASSFEIENHGMGTRSWASLLSFKAFIDWLKDETNPQKKDVFHPVIAVEEPEAHLHPNAQRVLYQQLKSTAKQQIVSTHSPYIAAQADLAEIRHFYKSGEKTEVNKITLNGIDKEVLRKIRREIIETRGELLFAKAVILFEGETEEQAIPTWADAYFQEKYNCSYFELGINFLGVGGGGKYRPFIQLFHDLNIKWFILSDYDKPDIQKHIQKIALDFPPNKTIDLSPNIVILGKDFEEYLIEEGYVEEWKRVIDKVENRANYLDYYINKNHGQVRRREKSNKLPCDTCHQPIFIDILRDYKQEEGELLALKDCLHGGKTKYGAEIADVILASEDANKRFPTKIVELFTKVTQQLHLIN